MITDTLRPRFAVARTDDGHGISGILAATTFGMLMGSAFPRARIGVGVTDYLIGPLHFAPSTSDPLTRYLIFQELLTTLYESIRESLQTFGTYQVIVLANRGADDLTRCLVNCGFSEGPNRSKDSVRLLEEVIGRRPDGDAAQVQFFRRTAHMPVGETTPGGYH